MLPAPPSPTNGGAQVRADGALHHEPLNDRNHEGSTQGFLALARLFRPPTWPSDRPNVALHHEPFTTRTMNPPCRGFVHSPIHPDSEGLALPLVIDGGRGGLSTRLFPSSITYPRFLAPAAAVNGRPWRSEDHKGRPRRRHSRRSPGASRIPQRPLTANDGATPGEGARSRRALLPANAPTNHEPFMVSIMKGSTSQKPP